MFLFTDAGKEKRDVNQNRQVQVEGDEVSVFDRGIAKAPSILLHSNRNPLKLRLLSIYFSSSELARSAMSTMLYLSAPVPLEAASDLSSSRHTSSMSSLL